jgi:hypothetical protein
MISTYVEIVTARNRVRRREIRRKRQCNLGSSPKCSLEHLMLERDSLFSFS